MTGLNVLDASRSLLDALNRGDRDDCQSLPSNEVVQSGQLDESNLEGPDATVKDVWSYMNTFPDLHIEVTDTLSSGNCVALSLTATGTYEPYTYGPAANRISWKGCVLVTARDGRLTHVDTYADWLTILDQLEGLPYSIN